MHGQQNIKKCMIFNYFYNSIFKIHKILLKVNDYKWSQQTKDNAHYKYNKIHDLRFLFQNTTNNLRRFLIYLFLSDPLHVSVSFSVHHFRSSKLHIQRQVFVRPIPDAVCAVLCSWWWKEEQSETCTASYRTKQIEKSRIFLVVFCEYISNARTCKC